MTNYEKFKSFETVEGMQFFIYHNQLALRKGHKKIKEWLEAECTYKYEQEESDEQNR